MSTLASGGLIGPARLLHTMLRVRDLQRSIDFYVEKLGMRLLRRKDFPEGQFTLAFMGYGDEDRETVIELTHNWGDHEYSHGTGFGHVAVGVTDVYGAARALANASVKLLRPAGPLNGDPSEIIALLEDPDGYQIELVGAA
jgi:lactoylglutathione lyase